MQFDIITWDNHKFRQNYHDCSRFNYFHRFQWYHYDSNILIYIFGYVHDVIIDTLSVNLS